MASTPDDPGLRCGSAQFSARIGQFHRDSLLRAANDIRGWGHLIMIRSGNPSKKGLWPKLSIK